MDMHVVNAVWRLVGQPRRIVVSDVVRLRVEEVEHVEPELRVAAYLRIEYGCRLRPHAVVLDQRTRADVAHEECARSRPVAIHSQPC